MDLKEVDRQGSQDTDEESENDEIAVARVREGL